MTCATMEMLAASTPPTHDPPRISDEAIHQKLGGWLERAHARPLVAFGAPRNRKWNRVESFTAALLAAPLRH